MILNTSQHCLLVNNYSTQNYDLFLSTARKWSMLTKCNCHKESLRLGRAAMLITIMSVEDSDLSIGADLHPVSQIAGSLEVESVQHQQWQGEVIDIVPEKNNLRVWAIVTQGLLELKSEATRRTGGRPHPLLAKATFRLKSSWTSQSILHQIERSFQALWQARWEAEGSALRGFFKYSKDLEPACQLLHVLRFDLDSLREFRGQPVSLSCSRIWQIGIFNMQMLPCRKAHIIGQRQGEDASRCAILIRQFIDAF